MKNGDKLLGGKRGEEVHNEGTTTTGTSVTILCSTVQAQGRQTEQALIRLFMNSLIMLLKLIEKTIGGSE